MPAKWTSAERAASWPTRTGATTAARRVPSQPCAFRTRASCCSRSWCPWTSSHGWSSPATAVAGALHRPSIEDGACHAAVCSRFKCSRLAVFIRPAVFVRLAVPSTITVHSLSDVLCPYYWCLLPAQETFVLPSPRDGCSSSDVGSCKMLWFFYTFSGKMFNLRHRICRGSSDNHTWEQQPKNAVLQVILSYAR